MLEASVDKDHETLFSESEVWLAHKFQMPVPSCNAIFLEDFDQRSLGALIPFSPEPGHDL